MRNRERVKNEIMAGFDSMGSILKLLRAGEKRMPETRWERQFELRFERYSHKCTIKGLTTGRGSVTSAPH